MSKQVFVTSLTTTDSSDLEGIGTIRWVGNRAYKWVRYDTGAGAVAAVAGNAAYYYAPSGAHATNDHTAAVVTSDLSDSAEIGAGILQSAPTDGQYCWIQIKGPATMASAFTAGVDGDPLTPTGSSDGKLDVSALVTDHVCATAVDAATFQIFCDFPF